MYEIFERLLKEKGLSAYKVAKATGVATATLSSWKKGAYTPKPEKLQKIADYLGVRLEYLMGESDIKTEQEIVNHINQSNGKDVKIPVLGTKRCKSELNVSLQTLFRDNTKIIVKE